MTLTAHTWDDYIADIAPVEREIAFIIAAEPREPVSQDGLVKFPRRDSLARFGLEQPSIHRRSDGARRVRQR
jgi:hypothetical protein